MVNFDYFRLFFGLTEKYSDSSGILPAFASVIPYLFPIWGLSIVNTSRPKKSYDYSTKISLAV